MIDKLVNGCHDCPFKDHENNRCSETGDIIDLKNRMVMKNCPLIQNPMRLVLHSYTIMDFFDNNMKERR